MVKSDTHSDLGEQLLEAANSVQDRLKACTSGPQTIIDADRVNTIEPDPTMKGMSVLVADDEAAVRKGVCDVLKRLGCEVTVCEDGTSTLEKLNEAKKNECPYHLIISDIRMPGCNGYEVFSAATVMWPNQSVVLMTGFGYDPHHSIMRASQEGMHTVLFKPFRTEQLIEIVKKACRKTAGC